MKSNTILLPNSLTHSLSQLPNRIERIFNRALDACKGGRIADCVFTGLGFAQVLHEVEEVGGNVGFKRDDEVLIIDSERVGGVQLDRRVLMANFNVRVHRLLPLFQGKQIPCARLYKGIDEQVLASRGAHHKAAALRRALLGGVLVLGCLGHREVAVGLNSPFADAGVEQLRAVLLEQVRILSGIPQKQVHVATNADQRITAHHHLIRSLFNGGGEFGLVLLTNLIGLSAPRSVELVEGKLDYCTSTVLQLSLQFLL